MLTIHKASAGSGKTFRLARNYIQLILGYQEPETGEWHLYPREIDAHRHILGVTFTNKATAEMKKRIIEELSLLADIETPPQKNKHLVHMMTLFNATHPQVAAVARQALTALLINFRDFNVSTIDSFFQTVLRTFAHELDLPDNFNLQLDDKLVVAEAVDDLLNTINGAGTLLADNRRGSELQYLKRWLLLYMSSQLADGKKFNIFNKEGQLRKNLIEFITDLTDEHFRQNSMEIMDWCADTSNIEKFEKELSVRRAQMLNTQRTDADQFARLLDDLRSREGDKVVKGGTGLETLLKSLEARESLDSTGKTTQRVLEGDGTQLFQKQFVERNPGHPVFEATVDFYQTVFERNRAIALLTLLRTNIFPLGLFGEVLRRVEAYRKQKNTFLLSDTNGFLQQIISNSDTPFIYERLGTKLRHFLLDEFQDTSVLQWKNLRPLIVDSLSTDRDNLIIGDEKQCIYRFRNSDPELINHRVHDSLKSRFHNIEVRGSRLDDNTNWRSDSLIVKFNNSLFPPLARMLRLERYYGNVVQKAQSAKNGEQGYVDILFLQQNGGGEGSETEQPDDTSKTLADEALERCSSHILRQLEAGYRPCDICVLVRKGNQAEKVIKHLLEVFDKLDMDPKPEVVSGDALKVSESRAVRYVIARLRLLLLPPKEETDIEKADKFEQRRRTRALLARFHLNNIGNDAVDADSTPALVDAIEGEVDPQLQRYNDKAISLSSVVEGLIAECLEAVDEQQRPLIAANENVYLSTLLDKTIEFEKTYGNNMVRFLDWWDSKGCDNTVKLPENPNAVVVSTIHKSKGLEYACVHVPFVDFQLYSSISNNSLHWFDMSVVPEPLRSMAPPFMPLNLQNTAKQAEFEAEYGVIMEEQRLDALNLLYVAFTRAVHELIATVTLDAGEPDIDKQTARISTFVHRSITATTGIDDLIDAADPERDAKLEYVLPLASHFDAEAMRFTLGAPTAPLGGGKEDAKVYAMPPFETTAPVVEITRPVNLHRTQWNDPRQRGDFLHNVLSHVRRWSDLDFALRQASYRQHLTDSEQLQARAILQQAYDALEQKHWFNDFTTVVNETTVYNFEPRTADRRRPDRLMIFPDGSIVIVDYKFAHPEEEHVEQVKRYVDYMRSTHGSRTVSGFLWYPLRREVVEV